MKQLKKMSIQNNKALAWIISELRKNPDIDKSSHEYKDYFNNIVFQASQKFTPEELKDALDFAKIKLSLLDMANKT